MHTPAHNDSRARTTAGMRTRTRTHRQLRLRLKPSSLSIWVTQPLPPLPPPTHTAPLLLPGLQAGRGWPCLLGLQRHAQHEGLRG